MNKMGARLTHIFLAVMVAGCAATSGVDTKEGACYLRASHGDVYLKVFDVDSDGNMGTLVWQGRINQGQTARITTTHAYVRYFYNSATVINQPLRGGVDKVCNSSDTVDVP